MINSGEYKKYPVKATVCRGYDGIIFSFVIQ